MFCRILKFLGCCSGDGHNLVKLLSLSDDGDLKFNKSLENFMEYKTKKSKEDAIVVLASCSSFPEAAKELGVTVQTIYNWLADPEFLAKLESVRNQIVSDAISKLKAHTTKAVETLVLLMDDENSQVRRGASNDILNHVSRLMEIKELEVRLKALEATQQTRGRLI